MRWHQHRKLRLRLREVRSTLVLAFPIAADAFVLCVSPQSLGSEELVMELFNFGQSHTLSEPSAGDQKREEESDRSAWAHDWL